MARSAAEGEGRNGAAGQYKVEAVSRAMLLLEALRERPSGLTQEALVHRSGLSAAVVDATLATLERHRLVRRADDAEGGAMVTLGLAWLRLADIKRQQIDIREVALPVMRAMRDAVNETVSLGIRIGSSRVNIEYAEGQHEVRRIVQPGFHVPLHLGAGGRALMSGLDDAEIEAYLAASAARHDPSSGPVARARLLAAIAAARRQGYAIVAGEITSDTAAVAAPVRNHVGDVVAALSISIPEDRFGPQMRSRCIREVVRGAREVSLALGWDPAAAR